MGVHSLSRLADYAERLFLILLSVAFLRALLPHAHEHPYLLLLAISECLPVLLMIIRRPGKMAMRAYPFVLAFLGTAAPLLVRPSAGGTHILPETLATALMALGLALNISSKLALWRSFGLAPANRGIRIGGPYAFVRHPMYLGYFLTEAGFLLANLTVANLAKYLVTWTVQLLRIREEEKFLLQDSAYRELAGRVRFRLVPGIY